MSNSNSKWPKFGEAYTKSSLELERIDSTEQMTESKEIDVAFLPEGGFLLTGQMNILGIKAIDGNGKGIPVEGEIVNGKGELATVFSTGYKGMGKILFNPGQGESYSIKIKGYPDFKYELNKLVKEGIKIEFAGKKNGEYLFRVTTNSKIYQEKDYYFALMHRGKVILYQKFTQKKEDSNFKLSQAELPGGISKVVLLDEDFKPLSERLFFTNKFEVEDIKINLDKEKYNTRTNVQLELIEGDTLTKQSFTSLSVSVVDEDAVRVNGHSQNILSYLLLDSELKGLIESPSDYFTDEETISSETKLDLLMLTQGWSNYLWNTIADVNVPNINESFGITIKGRIKRLFNDKPVENGNVVLGLFKDGHLYTYEGTTDVDGRFSIDSIFFTDTASVFVQARNSKGKLSTEVVLDPVSEKNPPASETYLKTSRTFSKLPMQLFSQKYDNELAMKAFELEAGVVLLDEISVNASKITKDDILNRSYPEPAISFKIREIDETKENVFSYLETRVVNYKYVIGEVLMGAPGSFFLASTPLIILNGVPTDVKAVEGIPMSNISVVDVYKWANETAMFGMRGGNGVISVYTKMGIPDLYYKNRGAKGAIASTLVGYSPYREFYSPKYTAENIDSKRPDNRITLYWNPNVITQNGKAYLSFFTSDDLANYKIFVEGITSDGKVCFGTAEFSVNESNKELIK